MRHFIAIYFAFFVLLIAASAVYNTEDNSTTTTKKVTEMHTDAAPQSLKNMIDNAIGMDKIIAGIWKDRAEWLSVIIISIISGGLFILYCEWSGRRLSRNCKPRFKAATAEHNA